MPLSPSTIGVSSPLFGGDGRPAVEPGAFFVSGEDNLRINSWNSLAGVVVTIAIRFLNSDGQIVPYVFTHTPNTNRTKATTDYPLGIGFPLNVQIVASTGSPLIGQTFVQAQIIRGLGGATQALATLLQGYVTGVQAVSWPGSPIVTSIEGGGVQRVVTGTLPAAAAEISETVPTGARWELLSLNAGLTTSATAGNRLPVLNLSSGGNVVGSSMQGTTIPASKAVVFEWGITLPVAADAVGLRYQSGLGQGSILSAGNVIGTSTTALQAADQWTAPQYLVREWLEAA